jgi:acylphosphatase
LIFEGVEQLMAPRKIDDVGVRLIFTGRVQGVYFRASTKEEALRLGLCGWVRNLPDGRVEAWVEGDRQAVGQLLEYCQDGIPNALVDMVDMEEGPSTGDHPSFEIRI